MPTMVLTGEYLNIAGNVLNEFTKKAELAVEVEEKDVTHFASNGWKLLIGGLKSGTLGCEFLQDFAATKLDSIMWPLLGSVVTFEVRPTQAAASASNPRYTGNILIKEWQPISGSVGDEATVGVSYPTSGEVVRATA
ncbi:phage tail tube protein [Kitasatospora sp. NPDC057500]|uniref:phage tail tube protein n=1 Tax=Kitasatospora sp. NPDC057500 TaxID=3346151 RepID=UPI0036A0F462